MTEAIFGPDHLNCADVREGAALALAQLGDRAAARAELRAAERIRSRALSADHPAVAHNLTLQGELALAAGEPAEAVRAFAAADAILQRAMPDNRHLLASIAGQRAIAAARAGDLDAAVEHGRRAEEHYAALGAGTEDVAVFYERWAHVLAQGGKLEEARASSRRSLALRRELHGEGHPALSQALQNLAQVEAALGDYAAALATVEAALANVAREPQPDPGRHGLCEVIAGTALAGLGRGTEAVPRLVRGLEALASAADGANLLEVFINAGLVFELVGRPDLALDPYRRALRIAAAHLDSAHRMQVTVRRLLGRALVATEAHDEAAKELAEAVSIAERVLPEDDADRAAVHAALAAARAAVAGR